MSGTINATVGYGLAGTNQQHGPTLEETEEQVRITMARLKGAMEAYEFARKASDSSLHHLEIAAHRAQVLGHLAGELVGATYNLQRAAFEKAMK